MNIKDFLEKQQPGSMYRTFCDRPCGCADRIHHVWTGKK